MATELAKARNQHLEELVDYFKTLSEHERDEAVKLLMLLKDNIAIDAAAGGPNMAEAFLDGDVGAKLAKVS